MVERLLRSGHHHHHPCRPHSRFLSFSQDLSELLSFLQQSDAADVSAIYKASYERAAAVGGVEHTG